MRDLFARLAGVSPVTPAGNPGNPDTSARGYRETPYKINTVPPVTPVTPKNEPFRHAPDQADLMDAYEERAAILEFDAGLLGSEAERRAWAEVMG